MGQFLQDGKNEQTLSKKNIFWRFTVTKRFDFFNFSQLFWRDFVLWSLKIVLMMTMAMLAMMICRIIISKTSNSCNLGSG